MDINFDVREFWKENEQCLKAFTPHKPRIPIDFWLDDHYLLEEMHAPSTLRYFNDYPYRRELHREFNNKAEQELGKRFYPEDEVEQPAPNRFEVLMGSHWQLTEGGTPWLESNVQEIADVKKLISKAEKLDMQQAAFPADWQEKKAQYEKKTGKILKAGGNFSRGPATMATSILGTTNTCLFSLTDPDVMLAFFALLAEKLVEYHCALMADTKHNTREGYQFNDDNCYLFSPPLYEKYCAPVVARIFKEFAPGPEHLRYQHSDSAMGHLMSLLNDLGFNHVNLGPTLSPLEIRKALPAAVIHGQLPPFTLRNGSAEEIINIVRRDVDTIGRDGKLIEQPAGSVAGGTSLEKLRIYMWAVHTYGRF